MTRTGPSHNGRALLRVGPPRDEADWQWVRALWDQEWGGDIMVSRGRVWRLTECEALIAWAAAPAGGSHGPAQPVGAATYRIEGDACELMSIDALIKRQGIGSSLLAAVEAQALLAGCARIWLITSNDNLSALGFYQRSGYRIVAVHPGAVDYARTLKPSIPTVGEGGIPIHDELELEKRLR